MGNEPCSKLLSFEKGAFIVKEGQDLADGFFLLRSGRVRISDNLNATMLDGRTLLDAGDFFCVAPSLAASPSHVSAVAETNVTVMCVSRDQFKVFIRENLPITTRILTFLSGQLRLLNEYFTHSKTQDPPESMLGNLYFFAEFYYKRNLFRQAYCAYHQYLHYFPQGAYAAQSASMLKKLDSYGKGIRFNFDKSELKRQFPIDTLIFSEFEPVDAMYIIQSGSIKITKIVDDEEVVLAILKKGDILGEMGLIDKKPRSANAIAVQDCEIMAIDNIAYLPILKDGIVIIENICTTLAERICNMHSRINKEVQDSKTC